MICLSNILSGALTVILVFAFVNGISQVNAIYDVDSGSEDHARAIAPFGNAGYIVVGYSNAPTASDSTKWIGIVMQQYDSTGNLLQQNMYRDPGKHFSVSLMSRFVFFQDSTFLVCGTIFDTTPADKGFIGRFSSSGDTTWFREIRRGNYLGIAQCIMASDSNIYCVAASDSLDNPDNDFVVLKLNTTGDIIWIKDYDFSGYFTGISLVENNSGGIIVAGNRQGGSSLEYYYVSYLIDTSGNWSDFQELFSPFGSTGALLTKVNSNEIIGHGVYGNQNTARDQDWIFSVNDSGYINWQHMYGSFVYYSGIWAVDRKSTGDILSVNQDYQFNVTANNYMGVANILQYTSTGDSMGSKMIYYRDSVNNYPIGMVYDEARSLIAICGSSKESPASDNDIWLAVISSDGIVMRESAYFERHKLIFPNPAEREICISGLPLFPGKKFEIRDLQGKLVVELDPQPEKINCLKLPEIEAGMYFLIGEDFNAKFMIGKR